MVSLLQVLPEYVLYWFVQKGKERHLIQGEVLFREGDTKPALAIVLDGVFSTAGGSKLEHQGAGSVIGAESLLLDAPRLSTVVAEEVSLVLEIPAPILSEKLANDKSFAADFFRALLTALSQEIRESTLRKSAAVQGQSAASAIDPAAAKAGEQFDLFKKLIVDLDREAIKHGAVPEDRCLQFLDQTAVLMRITNNILGGSSPLSETLKAGIGARMQQEMLPFVLTTETADRFYSKPRGYAGDYLAIHYIYENIPRGAGRLGPLIDRMFLESPPAKAVRNRRRLLAREILAAQASRPGEKTNVLCIASGPATEIFDAFASLEDKTSLKATLMDIDLQALAFVDEIRGRSKLAGQMTLINENLIALFLGRGTAKVEAQHLIYSIGLIDYLNDKLIGKLLRYVYDHLQPGGRVILGNFHPSNPAHAFMDHVLEWNLIHRTEDDMHRLFKNSPFNRACTRIQFEEEGINLFAECVRE